MATPHQSPQANTIVMIIVCLLLPPLGAALARGIGLQFILNIFLTLLGYLPGIIHAVWIIAKK